MKKRQTENILIIAASETDADLYYATGFVAPDPFMFIQTGAKKTILVNDLELDRAKAQAKVHRVVSTSQLRKDYYRKHQRTPGISDLIVEFARKHRIRKFMVPENFPAKYFDILRRRGIRLLIKPLPISEKRAVKTPGEIQAITKTLRSVESAVKQALTVLQKSKIKKGKLYYQGKILKSECIKKIIHAHLMEQGCTAIHSIVACGKQGINPHEEGSGPLRAHQPIILDIFPRHLESRYFADFTRTVVRGKASPKLKRMYRAVQEAQAIAFGLLRDGIDGKIIHNAILNRFQKLGFQTGLMHRRMQGFFHGTGHGIGLEVHEKPSIGAGGEILKAGQVVTVEPGLYYEDAGGVRLEDIAVITKTGCRNLTRFPKILEL